MFIRRFLFHYALLLMLILALIGIGHTVFQQIVSVQQHEQRHVAYMATATRLAQPTVTPSPSPSPVLLPTASPALLPTAQDLSILPTPLPTVVLGPDAPPSVTPVPHNDDLVNFLVLGSDRRSDTGASRTDVILIVSINRTTRTVNLLSIPRDLYVYIPGWGMDRINTAEVHQTQTRQTSHRLGLLAETIEYNLGLQIHHLARIDFGGFRALVDYLGGLTIPVDCPVSGYQLQAPGLDPGNLDNWVPFTLEPGVHHLDGAMTLWYVRQRMDSSDFERNRRQQIALRAIWHQLAGGNWLQDVPALWNDLAAMVETDLTINQAFGFLPLLLTLDSSRVESHFLGLNEVNLWWTPGGASVLVLDPVPAQTTIQRFLSPPTENQLVQENAHVVVMNASSIEGADQLAAARLEWLGFVAYAQGSTSASAFARTIIYDHTGRVKGGSLSGLQMALGVAEEDVIVTQDAGYEVDFTVVIGGDYIPCATSAWRPFPQAE